MFKHIKKLSVIISLLAAVLVQVLVPDSVKQPETPKPYFLYFLYITGIFLH